MNFVKIIKTSFFIFVASFTTTFIYIFMGAYTNGGQIIVDINSIGEMYLEATLIMIFMALLLIRTVIYFKETEPIPKKVVEDKPSYYV